MKRGLGIAILSLAMASSGMAGETVLRPYGTTPAEDQTLKALWDQAQAHSGRQSRHGPDGYKTIPVYRATTGQMIENACPSDPALCRNVLGAFLHVSRQMLIIDDLAPETSVADASIMVHEYVHALQNEAMTPDVIMKNCEAIEQEAISAQNRYLESTKSTKRMYSGHTCR